MKKNVPLIKKIVLFSIFGILLIIGKSSQAQYCAAKGNGCTEPNTDNHISKFVLDGKFTNTTTCEPGGYGDYTNFIATATVNENITGNVKCNKPGYFLGQVAIWVDWNNNFKFDDAGENVYVASTTQNWQGVENTFTITVPPGTSFGQKRLRVRTASTSGTMNPCGVQGIGEVEDYIIAVIDPSNTKPIAAFSSDTKVSCGKKDITFTNSSKYTDSVHWNFPGATPNFATGNVVKIQYDSAGAYDVKLIAFGPKGIDSTEKKAYMTIKVTDTADFSYPDTFFCQNGKMIKPIIKGTKGGTFLGDPSTIAMDSETGEIDVNASDIGTYTITYLTNGECFAEKSIQIVIDACTSIKNSSTKEKIKAYPNPAQDQLFVELPNQSNFSEMRIYTVDGKLIKTEILNKHQNTISLQGLETGLYFLNFQGLDYNSVQTLHIN